MHRGYIKTWRCCQDNELYFSEKFTKWQAWQDLLILANWEDGVFIKRNVRFEIKRGMLAWSVKALASRWQWSRAKVKRFLSCLESAHQIEHQTNTITTLIKIINYEKYQEPDIKTDIKRTSNGHQTDTSKESKELKNKEKINKKEKFNPVSYRPENISKKLWLAFIENRKAKKLQNTELALKVILKSLNEATKHGFTIEECIEEYISCKWERFDYTWMDKKRKFNDMKSTFDAEDDNEFQKRLAAAREGKRI